MIKTIQIRAGHLIVTEDNGEETSWSITGPDAVDPADLDYSNLPTEDPHEAGKIFVDETGHIAVSAG